MTVLDNPPVARRRRRVARGPLTAAQFHRIQNPLGVRIELVNGDLIVSPSPRFRHTHAVSRLFSILAGYVDALDIGLVAVELDTELGEKDVRRPDLLYVTRAKLRAADPDSAAFAEDAELVVEVLSPQSERTDRVKKFAQYAANGIPNYWIIDPDRRTFEAFSLRGKSYRLHKRGKRDDVVAARPFPKLDIPLARLWWGQ